MTRFPLLPHDDKVRLDSLFKGLESYGWSETVELNTPLAVILSNAVLFVNEAQTSTLAFIEEANMIGVRLVRLGQDDGDRDHVMLELHDSTVARVYAILDACGIVQAQEEWITWFRFKQWGESAVPGSAPFVGSGVINVTEETDGFTSPQR